MNPGAGKPGYMSSWTFNLQRELPAQFLLDIGCIGQRGSNLPSGLENLNQVDTKYLALGNTLNADINSAAARAAGIGLPYAGFRDRFRRRCGRIRSSPISAIFTSRSAGVLIMRCRCGCRSDTRPASTSSQPTPFRKAS